MRSEFPSPTGKAYISQLKLGVSGISITIQVETSFSKKHRRWILLALFRAIKPVYRHVRDGYIEHFDGTFLSRVQAANRGLGGSVMPKLKTRAQKRGFRIRMRRLMIGLTQQELADQVGIDRGSLSHIELGQVKARRLTILRIFEVLKSPKTPQTPHW